MATESDPGGQDPSTPKPTSPPWWQDPNSRPSWYPANAPWPPTLGPGQSYGEAIGQINYGPGSNPPTFQPGTPQPIPAAYGGPGAAPPPAPPPAGGTGGGSGVTPPSLAINVPNTPPGQVDLGGPDGLKYIPPTPDFSGSRPTFTAPTLADAAADPGQQFRLQQGEDALQNWAGAKGTLNDSSTAKALEDYGQASGQQGYTDVWNRDFAKYQGDVGTWQTGLVNPTMTAWQTRAAAGEFQTAQDYTNWWNAIINNQNNAKWFADHA